MRKKRNHLHFAKEKAEKSPYNTPKIVTRVKSSIDLAQLMISLESIHDLSYIYSN